tara:strand:+ start:1732 stop:2076 length:345 start_codon:yes stop_codon:yes gene_type:complete
MSGGKEKTAFTIVQKDDYLMGIPAWETQVPVGVPRSLHDRVTFVGHAHFGGKLRSVFETVDGVEFTASDMKFMADNLEPLGTVAQTPEKEYRIAKENFRATSESENDLGSTPSV